MTKTSILMATASIVLAIASSPVQAQTATAPDCQSILQEIANLTSALDKVLADAAARKATAASEQAIADAANDTWQKETALWHSDADGVKNAQNPNTQKLFQISATTHMNAALSARASYDQHMQEAQKAAAFEKDDYEMAADISQQIEQRRIRAGALCAPQNMIAQLPQNPGPQIPGASNGGNGLHFPPGGALGDPLNGSGNENGLHFPPSGALGDPLPPVKSSGNENEQPNNSPIVPGSNGGTLKSVSPLSKQVGAGFPAITPLQNNSVPNFGGYYASQRQTAGGLFTGVARARALNTAAQIPAPVPNAPVSSLQVPDAVAATAPVAMPAPQSTNNPGMATVTVNPMPAGVQVPCPPAPVQTVSQKPVSVISVPTNNTIGITTQPMQQVGSMPAAGMTNTRLGRGLMGGYVVER